MKIAYKINYHSFVDIITNSSSELFVSTDNNVITLFENLFKDKLEKDKKYGSYIKLMSFKKYAEEHQLEEFKEENPLAYEKRYGDMKEEDQILVCNVDSEDSMDFIVDVLEMMNFKSVY